MILIIKINKIKERRKKNSTAFNSANIAIWGRGSFLVDRKSLMMLKKRDYCDRAACHVVSTLGLKDETRQSAAVSQLTSPLVSSR